MSKANSGQFFHFNTDGGADSSYQMIPTLMNDNIKVNLVVDYFA
jgi:hypothetical protein